MRAWVFILLQKMEDMARKQVEVKDAMEDVVVKDAMEEKASMKAMKALEVKVSMKAMVGTVHLIAIGMKYCMRWHSRILPTAR